MKNKQLIALAGPAAIYVVLFCIIAGSFYNFPVLNVAWAADAHGNDITFILIEQWDGAAYQVVYNFTTSGGSTRVQDSLKIRFTVGVKLADSLASNQNEAGHWTDVKMNITNGGAIWTNKDLTFSSKSGPSAGFYYVRFVEVWDDVGKPAAGVTYTCVAKYTAYI